MTKQLGMRLFAGKETRYICTNEVSETYFPGECNGRVEIRRDWKKDVFYVTGAAIINPILFPPDYSPESSRHVQNHPAIDDQESGD